MQSRAAEETVNLPLTGIWAVPARLSAPDRVPLSPDAARLTSLNPLRDKSPPLEG